MSKQLLIYVLVGAWVCGRTALEELRRAIDVALGEQKEPLP